MRRYLEMELDSSKFSTKCKNNIFEKLGFFFPGDEALLADIQNEIFKESWGYCPNSPEEINYFLEITGIGLHEVIRIMHGDETAGYLWPQIMKSERLPEGESRGRIHMIGVLPEFRGIGLGRLLLLSGVRFLLEKGAGHVELTVDEQNVSAVELYKSIGFKQITSKVWYEYELIP